MTLARYLVLGVPLLALLAAAPPARTSIRVRGALLLSFLAALIGVAVLDRIARDAGWWSYPPVRGSLDGLPVDVWIGWAVLWGPLPVAVARRVPSRWAAPLLLLAVGWVDALTMPTLEPLVRLGPGWGWGEILGLGCVAAPAIVLGECTARATHLRVRVALQLAVFAGLVLWLLPTIVLDASGGTWDPLSTAPRWWLSLLAQALVLAAVPGVAAVLEFADRGAGTPYPWDPPSRLVTTGPYAYLANPMQVSATLVTGVVALATASWQVAVAAGMLAVFSEAVAEKHEDDDLRRRYGDEWAAYRKRVRRWIPRRRPAVFSAATLYLDLGCRQCREVHRGFERLAPTGLTLADARNHPGSLSRVRYERGDGLVADGTDAVARAAEHVDVRLAALGWLARFPVVRWLVARLADAVGFGPAASPVGRALPSTRTSGGTWRRTRGGG